jgi:hypothetical protein
MDESLVGKRFGIYNVKNGLLANEATKEGKYLGVFFIEIR